MTSNQGFDLGRLSFGKFWPFTKLSARTARLKQFVSYNVRSVQFKGWLGREFVTLTRLLLSFGC